MTARPIHRSNGIVIIGKEAAVLEEGAEVLEPGAGEQPCAGVASVLAVPGHALADAAQAQLAAGEHMLVPLLRSGYGGPVMLLRDLTNVSTVYNANIRTMATLFEALPTISLQLDPDLVITADGILPVLMTCDDVYGIARTIYADLDGEQEHFLLLIISAAYEVTGFQVIASGDEDHVPVEPREIYRSALLLGAHSIVAIHNHPSGSPRPSHRDIELTRQLVEAGKLLDIHVLDHLIYSARGYTSLAREHTGLFDIYSEIV